MPRRSRQSHSKRRSRRRTAARRRTWAGHDALEVLRSDTVWSKTKGIVAKAGGASIQMVIEVASSIVKEQLCLAKGVRRMLFPRIHHGDRPLAPNGDDPQLCLLASVGPRCRGGRQL